MNRSKRSKLQIFLMALGVAFVVAALGVISFNVFVTLDAGNKAETAYEQVKKQMGNATAVGTVSRTEVASVSVDGVSYVGTLDISALDLKVPVESQAYDEEGSGLLAFRYTGSTAENNLVLGLYTGDFVKGLSQAADGDEVVFTDVNGIVHTYEVVTIETIAGDNFDALEKTSKDWQLSLYSSTFGQGERTVLRCIAK